MRRLFATSLIAVMLATPAFAQEPEPASPAELTTSPPGQPAEGQGVAQDEKEIAAAAALVDCDKRRFETSVELVRDGKTRVTRMKLCATSDADDASWARTLSDAKAKIAENSGISDESKPRITEQLEAEIAKLAGDPDQ